MPSLRCVGYRQAWQHLQGEFTYQQFLDQGIAATRQLAKRQLTWLRSMDNVTVFEGLGEDMHAAVLDYVRREIEAQSVA